MKCLITGGAGYIGSVLTDLLTHHGHEVVIYDNLSTSPGGSFLHPKARFVMGDVRSKELVHRIIKDAKPDFLIHMAALTSVTDSIQNPNQFFDVNTVGTFRILEALKDFPEVKLIFSSTAAVYGSKGDPLVKETSTLAPENSYGLSKLQAEQMIQTFSEAYDIHALCFRYFNVAGASENLNYGSRNPNSGALFKQVAQAAAGVKSHVTVYGNQFDTKDGTGERDYIHVMDIAYAHIDAMMAFERTNKFEVMNIGYGHGYSVLEVIQAMEKVTKKKINYDMAPQRQGDIAKLFANSDKIKSLIGWTPRFDDIMTICDSTYQWELRNLSK